MKTKKFRKAIKRLWIIGTCTHRNSMVTCDFGEVKLHVCKRCGRVIGGIPFSGEDCDLSDYSTC